MKRLAFCLLLLSSFAARADVTTQNYSVSYTCTGSTGPYAFTFPISAAGALAVTQAGAVLSAGAYTIVPVNNNYANGGSVTLNSACSSGTLILARVTPLTQGTVFTDNMPIPMKTIERSFDKLTEIAQEQKGNIDSLATWSCPVGATAAGMAGFLPQCVTSITGLPAPVPTIKGSQLTYNGTSIAWQDKECIDVRDYGAVCSRTFDNVSALNLAISALPSSVYWGNEATSCLKFPQCSDTYYLSSRVTINKPGVRITGPGGVNCDHGCFMMGDTANAGLYPNITIDGMGFFPNVVNATESAIIDNSQGGAILNVFWGTNVSNQTFGHFTENWNNQNERILIKPPLGDPLRCDATFCGSMIYSVAPTGPYTGFSAVGHILPGTDLHLGCKGNAVDWQSGNLLDIRGAVIQGWSQFAVRSWAPSGGFPRLTIRDTFGEAGSCTNPWGNIGKAAIIASRTEASIESSISLTAQGSQTVPSFSSSGANADVYYLVAKDGSANASNLIPIGTASSDHATATTVYFAWPGMSLGGTAATVSILRTTGATYPNTAPNGTGNYLVHNSAGLTKITANCDVNDICHFADDQTGPSSYAVPAVAYFPTLALGGAAVILSGTNDTNATNAKQLFTIDDMPQPFIITAPPNETQVIASHLNTIDSGPNIGVPSSTLAFGSSFTELATLFPTSRTVAGGTTTGKKGRLNFGPFSGDYPSTVLTLGDSNAAKTRATQNNRPDADASDWGLGYDSAAIIWEQVPTTRRWYFGKKSDGAPQASMDATGITTTGVISAATVGGAAFVSSAGHASCWKTATTLSYCESVVGADGTCTCH